MKTGGGRQHGIVRGTVTTTPVRGYGGGTMAVLRPAGDRTPVEVEALTGPDLRLSPDDASGRLIGPNAGVGSVAAEDPKRERL
jgi:hypothetical protein